MSNMVELQGLSIFGKMYGKYGKEPSRPAMTTYVTTLPADSDDPRNDGFTPSIPGMGARSPRSPGPWTASTSSLYSGVGLSDVLVEIGVLLATFALIFIVGICSFRVES